MTTLFRMEQLMKSGGKSHKSYLLSNLWLIVTNGLLRWSWMSPTAHVFVQTRQELSAPCDNIIFWWSLKFICQNDCPWIRARQILDQTLPGLRNNLWYPFAFRVGFSPTADEGSEICHCGRLSCIRCCRVDWNFDYSCNCNWFVHCRNKNISDALILLLRPAIFWLKNQVACNSTKPKFLISSRC